ncbi:MAG: HsdR family type I site-specific deoxyribonuclease [Candidatus Firestonebacteria bacterium]
MSERGGVQNPILKYVQELGWEYVNRETAEKYRQIVPVPYGTEPSLFFVDLFYKKVKEFNPKYDESKEALIKTLSTLKSNIHGNREFLQYLRGEKTFFCKKENREPNLILIDFDNPKNNTYQVTDEYYYSNGKYGNREDIVFLINGLPVAVIECKNATKEEALALGIDQIRRYHRETPEMMVSEQMFTVTESLGFSYGVTWNMVRRNIFNWKEEEIGQLESKVKTFFTKEHILSCIKNFIIFSEKDEELNKYILRQYQIAAVKLVFERALDKERCRGLVWHTQGSGKTFTMIKVAEMLFKAPEAEKPTIILLIDRNELEDQLIRNLHSVGIEHAEKAGSITKLNKLLKDDFRGIVVSMIHKFADMPANINMRKNIYVLVDEAHRTTQGDLGNFLMAAIPNASFIGFTGTPVDNTAHGKGTFKIFGIDDKKGYLHKYSIADSIKDGTTLPLFYALAPNDLLVPEEILEKEFLALAEAEGISDIDELNRVIEKAVNTRTFLKGKERVDEVARFVAKHYKDNVEPLGYKAFMVGVDREACAMYKKALDKYLPKEYSSVIYTGNNNDSEELKKHHITKEAEKKIRKEFIKPDKLPKIFIVTDKLLTGYDAPILYAMYLDKPMRDHTLLQAIARVNRPYEIDKDGKEVKKPHGFVLDFIGIFNKLKKALAFDSDEVNAVIKDIGLLKQLFETKMKKESARYLGLIKYGFTDKDTDAIIEYFKDKSKREGFRKFYKEIEALYEIISPDAFLRPYINDYSKLSQIYHIVLNAFFKRASVDREFLQKTKNLIQEKIGLYDLHGGMDIYEINENTLKKIKEKGKNNNTKVINLVKSIEKYVIDNPDDLLLISLSARAKAIQELYEDRQEETQDILDELYSAIETHLEQKKEMEAKGFDGMSAFVNTVLTDKKIKDPDKTTKEIKKIFDEYPNWQKSEQEKRELRTDITLYLASIEDDMDKYTDTVEYLFKLLEDAENIGN